MPHPFTNFCAQVCPTFFVKSSQKVLRKKFSAGSKNVDQIQSKTTRVMKRNEFER